MVPFGHELGADDDVEAPLRDIVELGAQPLDRFDEVARKDERSGLRKQSGDLLGQPFDPGAAGDERVGRLAFWAGGRRRQGNAAMVTDEPPPEPMIDQPGVAVRAMQAKAAGAAQRQRRVAAAIEEKERLLAALERELHRL